jgi:DNA modification methylase
MIFIDAILEGNNTETLKTLPDKSIDCCITSPPYFLQRRYSSSDAEIGREDSPMEYVNRICDVFDEVKRVLKDDGSLWLNLGDTYAGCYDEDTEVFTDSGFKYFKDLQLTDKVLSMNPLDYTTEYLFPDKYHAYHYRGKMLSVEGKALSLLVTPDHNMLVKKRRRDNCDKGYTFEKACAFYNKQRRLRKICLWSGYLRNFVIPEYITCNDQHEIRKEILLNTESFMKLLGLYVTEGHLTKESSSGKISGICITQKKKENFELIRSSLSECFGRFNEYSNDEGVHKFFVSSVQVGLYFKRFGTASHNKRITRDILNLPSRYLEILKKSMIIGDGHISKCGKISFYSISKELADNFQELSIKTGKCATIRKYNPKGGFLRGREILKENCRSAYEIYETSRNEVCIYRREYRNQRWVDYDGKVYCVTLPKWHSLLVRRHGRVIWCGNSGKGGANSGEGKQGYLKGEVDSRLFKSKRYPPKSLIGIPWMTAFGLIERGWMLREDIVWAKPSPLPEPCTDRFVRSHEFIFLFVKKSKYYFNHSAALEPAMGYDGRKDTSYKIADYDKAVFGIEKKERERWSQRGYASKEGEQDLMGQSPQHHGSAIKPRYFGKIGDADKNDTCNPLVDAPLRTRRDVWTIASEPSREGHYAMYPQRLVLQCLLCGCPEGGVVLDPFLGSGTTAIVARKNNRHFVGCELNPEYIKMARRRLDEVSPLLGYEVSK